MLKEIYKLGELEILSKLKEKELETHPLHDLFWECTLTCNAKCKHCGSSAEKKRYEGELTTEEIKSALNMFKTKIKFTYEPIPEVFEEISKNVKNNIAKIFEKASIYMKTDIITNAWGKSLEEEKNNTSLTKSDIEIIKGLSTLLGNVDLEGQVNNINLINELIDKQIEEARVEKNKNEKLYKTLGASIGLTIAIILI